MSFLVAEIQLASSREPAYHGRDDALGRSLGVGEGAP